MHGGKPMQWPLIRIWEKEQVLSMSLSVIMPVFNENATIEEIIRRVQSINLVSEFIIIDDGSTDGTREELIRLADADPGLKLLLHERNQGKGAAVRTGIAAATQEFLIIQDADLEYDPREYHSLMVPMIEARADAVYGSRFLGGPRRSTMFWHAVANRLLTFATNLLYNSILTDMETGYKLFRTAYIQSIPLNARRFEFEPEVTAKLLKRKARIFEVPISFDPREYADGKKIGLSDAFEAVWALLKYRFVD